MIRASIPKVVLGVVRLDGMQIAPRRDKFAGVSNLLLEDKYNMLLENGGCILV